MVAKTAVPVAKIPMLGTISGKTSVMFATKLPIRMVVKTIIGTEKVVGLKTGKTFMLTRHTNKIAMTGQLDTGALTYVITKVLTEKVAM